MMRIMTVAMLATTVLDMFSITESFKSGSTNMNSILLRRRTRSVMSMNFFDNIKIIFSKEGQDNIKAFDDKEKEEALIAQKEILARRRYSFKLIIYKYMYIYRYEDICIHQINRILVQFQHHSDPKKMREYEQKNEANRIKLAEERAVYKFQQKQAEGIIKKQSFIHIYIDILIEVCFA